MFFSRQGLDFPFILPDLTEIKHKQTQKSKKKKKKKTGYLWKTDKETGKSEKDKKKALYESCIYQI